MGIFIKIKNRIEIEYKKLQYRRYANGLFRETIKNGKCYLGPFVGEFGHVLGHIVPFISYLYKKGVKVEFCGIDLFKPYFIDDKGNCLVEHYHSIPDFYGEITPIMNQMVYPDKVKETIKDFYNKANDSGMPFWDISDSFFYEKCFRYWIHKKKYHNIYKISNIYKSADEDSVVIFPRKKTGARVAVLQGEEWDFKEIASLISKFVNKVYVLGHPAFSAQIESFDNVEVILTNDNSKIIEKCSNCKLIIAQHSGVNLLSEYTDSDVLIIYKGNGPIGNIDVTIKERKKLGIKSALKFAYSTEEIVKFVQNYSKSHNFELEPELINQTNVAKVH